MGCLWLWQVGAALGCGAQASHCGGFFCCRAQALGLIALVVVTLGLSCRVACRVFLDQGSNLCPLHWQVIANHWATMEVPACLIFTDGVTVCICLHLLLMLFFTIYFFPSIFQDNTRTFFSTELSLVFPLGCKYSVLWGDRDSWYLPCPFPPMSLLVQQCMSLSVPLWDSNLFERN